MPVVVRKPSNVQSGVGLGVADVGAVQGDVVDLEAGQGHAAVGHVVPAQRVGAVRDGRGQVDPLAVGRAGDAVAVPRRSLSLVGTFVHVSPPSLEASR